MRIIRFALAAASIALMAGSLPADEPFDRPLAEPASYLDDSAAPPPAWEPAGDSILWSVKAGAVILQRGRPHSSVVVESFASAPILNAHDYSFNWAAGPDISVTRRIAGDTALEVRYFGVDDWQSRVSGDFPGFFEAPGFRFDTVYQSKLFSTEVNLRQAAYDLDWLTWLAGFRWVEVSENLARVNAFPANETNVNFSTLNQLYGGQIGADMQLWSDGPWSLDCVWKGGLFANAASNHMSVLQRFGPPPSASDQRGQLAFVGEIDVAAVYQWNDHVALRGGYQLLWTEGVAVAGDQPAATNVATHDGINSQGGIFYHGAVASLNFTW